MVTVFSAGIEKVGENVTENVTENKIKDMLILLRENKFTTTTEIANALNITRRTVARYIELLKSEGRIKRIGPDKGGYWKVVK